LYSAVWTTRATWARRSAHLGRELADSAATAAVLAATAAVGIGRRAGAPAGWLVSGAAAAGLLGWHYRETTHRLERLIRSAEDAAALSASLGPAAPVFGRWAAEGDFAGMIVRELERSPRLVVECGSGSTTLVIADKLRQSGSGRVVSLEHDAFYAARTTRLINLAGLSDLARVVEAPLRPQQFADRIIEWYDRPIVEEAIDGEIDVLVVDGPPQLSPWARWPALEVFYPLLVEDAVVLLDDGRTRQTSRAVRAWVEQFTDLDLYWLDTVKGTWLLRRGDGSGLGGPLLRIARLLHPRPSGFGRWPVHR
jgi:predicted O-methyltransferase YrrM